MQGRKCGKGKGKKVHSIAGVRLLFGLFSVKAAQCAGGKTTASEKESHPLPKQQWLRRNRYNSSNGSSLQPRKSFA
jgi:hypothetical protein